VATVLSCRSSRPGLRQATKRRSEDLAKSYFPKPCTDYKKERAG
jgi:hypothetical protein